MRDLLLDAAATFRLTRLWVKDDWPPIRAARELAEAKIDARHGPEWASGITCPWCVSAYVALGVITARRVAPRWWDVAARALTFSAAAGFLSGDERG